ncbi:CoA pyrophosphatase [Granulibacter bethesdensis]|uniref:CoA pyrophosphatase n=1 Tax=Granulibacter bethesdensis (strain ATCC BAA-1260 / CGDNIH1) TaxID=391165 RepID=Q0BRM0_GRABC|nr:CoA pyrophosphatase [Granulibacter bethesdensis]ABI62532.1 CoA pyrophosphatase [Granulibacter bethesdensis CGDNIH1]AHJ68528.1 CoA pyrophosphatase [Granulibacter bethesdensis]APH52378.1 CoA pyrophosphatase [Granulibacter bethesdensis]APH65068.1 CoA pyrophosphatase [Granulibacter bethesdensis]
MEVEETVPPCGIASVGRYLRTALALPGPDRVLLRRPEMLADTVSMMRAAAVLVGITEAEEPGIILTLRAAGLSHHAGQVSFPGGRIDPGDASPEHAALREAREEVGLLAEDVHILGRLDPVLTGTGFVVTPVVGLVRPDWVVSIAPAEVAAVFELKLRVLLDPDAPRQDWLEVRGMRHQSWVWPHEQHVIWGATATILMELSLRLRQAEAHLASEPGF